MLGEALLLSSSGGIVRQKVVNQRRLRGTAQPAITATKTGHVAYQTNRQPVGTYQRGTFIKPKMRTGVSGQAAKRRTKFITN
jgi:hypothetical protein